jgi:hypothetical protein
MTSIVLLSKIGGLTLGLVGVFVATQYLLTSLKVNGVLADVLQGVVLVVFIIGAMVYVGVSKSKDISLTLRT